MNRIMNCGIALMGATTVSFAVLGPGVAIADDYAGKTYGEVSSALSNAGMTAIVAAIVGGKLSRDECLVTNSHMAPFVRDIDGSFMPASREVMLSLNCNGAVASSGSPGNSLASPEGRAAKTKLEDMEWRRQNPEWCEQTESEHPAWAPLEGCHSSDE